MRVDVLMPEVLLFLIYEKLVRFRSGVMRITVTVVVIMFELTGALTYILPTMVSLHKSPSLDSIPFSRANES